METNGRGVFCWLYFTRTFIFEEALFEMVVAFSHSRPKTPRFDDSENFFCHNITMDEIQHYIPESNPQLAKWTAAGERNRK